MSVLREVAKALAKELGGDDCEPLVRAVLAALDRAGWQCVPKVATDEMAWELCVTLDAPAGTGLNEGCDAWEAALAAAPKVEGE